MKITKSGFKLTPLNRTIKIENIVTVHYFEYPSTFLFKGESHDFWEFLYVDKGEVGVTSGEKVYQLKQGQIIFHTPNQFHDVFCNGKISPNLLVVSFDCNSEYMSYFEDKVMNINNHLSLYLHTILKEAKLTYENDLADPYFTELKLNPTAPKFSQDLIAISLEGFLIELIRLQLNESNNTSISIHEKENNRRVQKVINYLESNITTNITLENICTHCSMSRSLVQKLFKDDTGWSVMEYFYRLKIEEAKRLIRNGTNNFTQIADHLGYSTIHYFSRQFKKIVGMSPSEYSKSILNLAQEERYKQF
ncbi:MAG: AraC family transcriptional regulator [Sphaerochaetaceae bacterium]|nr:AraC family transcriptional regulator [Sphaerochaetaceae bacterium]MDC7237444.1 AraC family transcriptional regulator [Sphaerochaetaceae bacterium]MDC7249878.1 AraC family transcriptional regulator [Sphaerochaetaceae bacterium]